MPRHLPPPDYIYNEDFDNLSEKVILGPMPASTRKRSMKVGFDKSAYIGALYDTQLLTQEQEAHLFRKYNYLRWKITTRQSRLKLATLFGLAQQMVQTEQLILESNLRLVVYFSAKRTNLGELHEIISEGNMALIRAIKRFDYSRGWKFSTYAGNAILTGFTTMFRNKSRYDSRWGTQWDLDVIEDVPDQAFEQAVRTENIKLVHELLTRLNPRERDMMERRFGLGQAPQKLVEIGAAYGLTKERVRVILLVATAKLSNTLERV